jgi:gp16 family phage-associated protein
MAKHRTTDDFLRELRANDRTVADWCREHGFNQALAYRVLSGKNVGHWGETRRIAKAMRLQLPEVQAPRRTPQLANA